jgi:tellurium resistance protein TerD
MSYEGEKPEEPEEEIPEEYDDGIRRAVVGDRVDLLQLEPTLKKVRVAAGWDQKAFEEQPVDLDLCCFLLDKSDQTREDDDFVFYNHEATVDETVKHMGDNRTGAGDGDDEIMLVDLNGVSFDVFKVMFALAVYDPDLQGHDFSMVRNVFVRVVNDEDGNELVRYEIPEEELSAGVAIRAAVLEREGPKWFFKPLNEPEVNGLAAIATDYGMIIAEYSNVTTGVNLLEEPPLENPVVEDQPADELFAAQPAAAGDAEVPDDPLFPPPPEEGNETF